MLQPYFPNLQGVLLCLILVCYCDSISGQNHPVLSFDQVYSGFSSPIYLANAGDGSNRLFVVERAGRIKIIENGSTLATPFLDINDKVLANGERGLLGLDFHPDYPTTPYLFVYYNDNNGDTRIARFTSDPNTPNVIDTSTEELILLVDQPASNHNGGTILFGPDGYLYIGLGDGGNTPTYSQDPTRLLGKMLRIDVDNGLPYTVPASNPFTMVPGTLNEIWAFGLRNPFRWSFDRLTGDMWIGDVGQNEYEEVDFQPASSMGGENYGWQCYEGDSTYNTSGCGPRADYTFPAYAYEAFGGFAVTGGNVYRGKNTCLYGVYICADSQHGTAYTIVPDGLGWHGQEHLLDIFGIVAFGEDEAGELYAVRLGGQIYKVNGSTNALANSPLPSGTYSAGSLLTSSGTVLSGANVIFRSGEHIELLPQFEVQLGGILTGEIGCDN